MSIIYGSLPRGHLTSIHPGPAAQRVDNAIHWISHDPVDSIVCFINSYPLDSDLSGG